MSSDFEGVPLRFTSETLTGLVIVGLTLAVALPCVWVVIRVALDIRDGIRDRRTSKGKGKKGDDDIEAQASNITELELHEGEKDGGLCELEQPGLPELSGIGIMEMWEEGCAKEVDGGMMPVEMDAYRVEDSDSNVEQERKRLEDVEQKSSTWDRPEKQDDFGNRTS
jgi:hypothetical protein